MNVVGVKPLDFHACLGSLRKQHNRESRFRAPFIGPWTFDSSSSPTPYGRPFAGPGRRNLRIKLFFIKFDGPAEPTSIHTNIDKIILSYKISTSTLTLTIL